MTFYFTDDNERKLFLNDKNYDVNILTFSSVNKNETKILGRDDLGRDSFRKNESLRTGGT